MKDYKAEIEKIVDDHFMAHPAPRNSGIKKIQALITESNKEAVDGFAEYIVKWTKRSGQVSEGHSLAEDGIAPFMYISAGELGMLVSTYLSQDTQPKEGK